MNKNYHALSPFPKIDQEKKSKTGSQIWYPVLTKCNVIPNKGCIIWIFFPKKGVIEDPTNKK